MRTFRCDRCATLVAFDASTCHTCGARLGYVTARRGLASMRETARAGTFEIDGDEPVWRCLNAAWGCNWVVTCDSASPWCRSCALTRGRPAAGRTDAIIAWMEAESAKRRLVHQLDELALPVEARSETVPHGLTFDLVDVPGERVVTGHLDGVVTLDLAETDEHHRDDLRRRLDEPIRTVVGHLRHEVGHHYWRLLAAQPTDIARFRDLFGDERSDYAGAIEHHYDAKRGWDPEVHITAYASAHPLEDWAETFAHYLHLIDAVGTAAAHHLVSDEAARATEFAQVVDTWRDLNSALTAIAEGLGAAPLYPIAPAGVVVDKLAFVHGQIAAHTTGAQCSAVF